MNKNAVRLSIKFGKRVRGYTVYSIFIQKNYKKRLNGSKDIANRPFWARFAQFGPNRIFSNKLLHHPKRVMVFYLYTKNYEKRSNGSKDIAIRRIERSDWSRGEMPISREPDFSQTCDFRKMIENHNIFHFKLSLIKTNDSILHKCPKKKLGQTESGSVTFLH